MNHSNDIGTPGINWRRGVLRLWVIASVLWSGVVFSVALLEGMDANGGLANFPAVHVRISDTETWDYPAGWNVQHIRDDLEKRLAAEDAKDREWAAHVPEFRKAECRAIPPATPFSNQPDDCVRLFFASDRRAVPSGWESQVTAAPDCKNGTSSCKPWERKWSNSGLQLGAVVTEQGVIHQIDARVGWWEVLIAAAPWAFAPPIGILVLVASLFWALAGFQRQST